MYTKEKIQSKENINNYILVGKLSLKKMNEIESVISKRNINKDLTMNFGLMTFERTGNTLHYSSIKDTNKNGYYLKTDVTKEIGDNHLNISLERGILNFDLSTGEKYDRKLAKVEYTYQDNKINFTNIEDEIYYNELEEKRKIEINERVKKLKK